MGTAVWLLVGIVIVVILGSVAIFVTRQGDEEEHDIEHLDHQIHGDAN